MSRGPRPIPLRQRFDAKWELNKATGCWLWTGGLNEDGYGRIALADRRMERAHRVAWRLYRDPLLEDAQVLHTCDTPACVNPDHLFLGDHAANMADMAAKGRAAAGERNAAAKLSQEDLARLRSLRHSGLSQRDVATRFGISQSQVSLIWAGKRRQQMAVA